MLEFFSNPYFNKGGLESFPSFQSFNLRTTYEMDERDEFQFYFARFIDAYYAGILFQYGLLDLVNGPLELWGKSAGEFSLFGVKFLQKEVIIPAEMIKWL